MDRLRSWWRGWMAEILFYDTNGVWPDPAAENDTFGLKSNETPVQAVLAARATRNAL